MVNKKKLFIFIFISVLGILILFFVSRRKDQVSQKPIPSLKIPQLLEGQKATYDIKITESDFKFPKSIPLLEREISPITDENARNLATQLGFYFEPLISEDVFDGTTYIYRGTKYSLIIRLKVGEIEYKQNSVPGFINKNLSNEDITFTAKKFLVDNGFYSENDIESSSISYYLESQSQGSFSTSKENAAFYHVNFTFKVAGFPILTLNPSRPPVYVQMLPDGEIFKAHVETLTNLKESSNKYNIKNYKETLEAIELDKAITVSLNNGNINLADVLKGSFEKITITGIEIAYLLNSARADELQPVFLLSGKASINTENEEVDILLYLPAISRSF
jgi:hypothetical protein